MAKTPKVFQPVIATANLLRTGDVVFRTGAGTWSRDVADAGVAETAEAAALLQGVTEADQAANLVVDHALIPMVRDGAGWRPSALRERIRARGPTITMPVDGAQSAPSPPRTI